MIIGFGGKSFLMLKTGIGIYSDRLLSTMGAPLSGD